MKIPAIIRAMRRAQSMPPQAVKSYLVWKTKKEHLTGCTDGDKTIKLNKDAAATVLLLAATWRLVLCR